MLHEYLWAVILGGIFCFTLGFGMGSNDVSNNFGTSIGSKSITLGKAIIIAGIFELVGSVGFGSSVTDSVRKGIYKPDEFGEMPDIMLVANVAALISGTSWLLFCSATGQSVSTTHSLVGAMLGCGLAIGGHAVNWPYLGTIVMSWFITPLASFVVGMIYFALLRWFMLRSPHAVSRGFKLLPFLIFIICFSFVLFFTFSNPLTLKGVTCDQKDSTTKIISKKKPCIVKHWAPAHPGIAFGIAVGVATGLSLILLPIVWFQAKRTLRKFDEKEAREKEGHSAAAKSERTGTDLELTGAGCDGDDASAPVTPEGRPFLRRSFSRKELMADFDQSAQSTNFSGRADGKHRDYDDNDQDDPKKKGGLIKRFWNGMAWNHDLHKEAFEEDSKAVEIANLSEKFPPKTECFFNTLQVVSASIACLLHGSNDVANAAAPFASVYSIYQHERFEKSLSVPIWILFLGGAAITAGLTIFGHRVIKTVGIELFHVTPARGFCVEMALSTVLIVGTFLGLPLSTTHIGIGAMVGIGLLDSHIDPVTQEDTSNPPTEPSSTKAAGQTRKKFLGFINLQAINWKVFLKLALAWVGTIVMCAVLSCSILAFAIYTPSNIHNRYRPCSEWNPSCIIDHTSATSLLS